MAFIVANVAMVLLISRLRARPFLSITGAGHTGGHQADRHSGHHRAGFSGTFTAIGIASMVESFILNLFF